MSLNSLKKALITGVSKGIGLATAIKLLNENYFVYGISRSLPPITHPHFIHYKQDLSSLKSLPHFLKTLTQEIEVDTLICNAGFGLFGHLEQFSYEQIDQLINLNFLSQSYFAKAFLPIFKKRGHGSMIFIGSEAALCGKKKGSIYCASKFALRGFVQALREECGQTPIQITLINPGMVKTDFFQNLNFSHGEKESESILPEDVAETIYFISSMRTGTHFDEINLSPQNKTIFFK